MSTTESRPARDYDFTAAEEQFRAELRAFLDETLPEDWVSLFSAPDKIATSDRVARELADRGWLIQHWPAEYGGQDGSIWMQAVAQEELWAHGEPRGGQYMNVNWIGPAIMHFGTEEQKHALLPPIMDGAVTWAQLFSEPGAGSDLAGIALRADVQEDGTFLVNGQKTWTSYGDFATKGFLVARTDPASRRRHGLSVFVIDMDLPGIEAREIRTSLGDHRIAEVFFTDVRVPADALLGNRDDGWNVAMTALGFERSGSARYARSTRILGRLEQLPEAQDACIRREIAAALAVGRATELMNYRVIALKEQGRVPTWEASAARVHNALYEVRVAAIAERVLGAETRLKAASATSKGRAEIASLCTTQAPTVMVTAGTYEIQLGIIAQRKLGMERAR